MDSSRAIINGQTVNVKILDKSKRAFDLSVESTEALEFAISKKKGGCCNAIVGFFSWWYSLWLLSLKHHGKPPSRRGLPCLFFGYSLCVAFDIICSAIMFVHVMHPWSNMYNIGIAWLLCLPLVTVVGPVWGLVGSMFGSTTMLKTYSSMNATAFLVNIPLTIACLIYFRTQMFYIFVLFFMEINKMFISFLSAKVRQHLINPGYKKNKEKMEQRFRNIVSARADILTKGNQSTRMSAAERAAMLTASGTPSEALMGSFAGGDSSDEADSLGEEEENETYGIVSKNDLAQRRA